METVETKWLALFDDLRKNLPVGGEQIAAPFLSAPPAGYDPLATPSILYVGKATLGDWELDSFLRSPTVKERRECTSSFLEECIQTGNYSSAFWRFACALSERLAVASHNTLQPLQNLVWTNICKIGVLRGNPKGELLRVQKDLAVETLRLEIQTYLPRLIVLVTGNYAASLVAATVGDPEQRSWRRECEHEGFWWREATSRTPAILWTYHPERKRTDRLEVWLRRALQLAI